MLGETWQHWSPFIIWWATTLEQMDFGSWPLAIFLLFCTGTGTPPVLVIIDVHRYLDPLTFEIILKGCQ
jgi:hypothetical protein